MGASRNKVAAQAFLDYLKSPAARATFERYGFFLPPRSAEAKHKL